jgi:hypothetical protein
MSQDKSFTKNAADEQRVEEAAKRERRVRERELNDIRAILSTKEGRRFAWRLMGHCKVFQSVWESSARIHYSSGQQDVGHFVMAEIVAADQNAFLQMMKENQQGELNDV